MIQELLVESESFQGPFRKNLDLFITQRYFDIILFLSGAVSLLSPEQRRHLHGQWGRAPDRQSAWRLRASAYLWLPAAELPVTAGHLRQHFALLATLRLDPKVRRDSLSFFCIYMSYLSTPEAFSKRIKLIEGDY